MTPTPTFADLLALHEAVMRAMKQFWAQQPNFSGAAAGLSEAESAFRTALASAFATPGQDEVERVAHAMYECWRNEIQPPADEAWDDTDNQQLWHKYARAAIAAMSSDREAALKSGLSRHPGDTKT